MLANLHNSVVEPDERVIFLNLYKVHYQDLYRYGYRISKDKEITKDCIQQMFLELWNKEDRFSTVTKLKPYLIKYLQRKILKEISKKRICENGVPSKLTIIEESYESILIKNQQSEELRTSLKAAIKCLTKRQMQIVELRFMDGHSFDEIAEILGLQHRTLYNQLHSAIKTLREKISNSSHYTLFLLTSFLF